MNTVNASVYSGVSSGTETSNPAYEQRGLQCGQWKRRRRLLVRGTRRLRAVRVGSGGGCCSSSLSGVLSRRERREECLPKQLPPRTRHCHRRLATLFAQRRSLRALSRRRSTSEGENVTAHTYEIILVRAQCTRNYVCTVFNKYYIKYLSLALLYFMYYPSSILFVLGSC